MEIDQVIGGKTSLAGGNNRYVLGVKRIEFLRAVIRYDQRAVPRFEAIHGAGFAEIRSLQTPAEPVIQGQAPIHLELILRINSPGGPAKVPRRIGDGDRGSLRDTQEKVRITQC